MYVSPPPHLVVITREGCGGVGCGKGEEEEEDDKNTSYDTQNKTANSCEVKALQAIRGYCAPVH